MRPEKLEGQSTGKEETEPELTQAELEAEIRSLEISIAVIDEPIVRSAKQRLKAAEAILDRQVQKLNTLKAKLPDQPPAPENSTE